MPGHQPSEALLEVLRQPVESSGLDLEAVEVSSAGRRRVVRVLVDKDGGVSLDDLADATRLVSATLDASDVLGEAPYTLEVTSPGVDRPLTHPRHWRRNIGRLVTVTAPDGSTVTGRITDASESEAVLEGDAGPTTVSFAQVSLARIEIEFSRPKDRAATGSAARDASEEV